MTREENLHWIDEEIRTWENECQSKHPIKEALYAARKALEQESCEDAVSRKTIDQNIYDYAESNGLSYANLKNVILDAPSVTLTQKWIPVTERLPEEGNTYEVTLQGIGELEGIDNEVAYATWLKNRNDWLYHDVDNWKDKEVIAWKQLSKPYKAESEDEK